MEDSNFFERKLDAIIAWGLLFLLPADVQAHVTEKRRERSIPAEGFFSRRPS